MSVRSTVVKPEQKVRHLLKRRPKTTGFDSRKATTIELNGAVIRSHTSSDLRGNSAGRTREKLLLPRTIYGATTTTTDDKSRRLKRRKRGKYITVDTSRARTAAEVVRAAIQQLGPEWKEAPRGQRSSCHIYWHGISFYDSAIPIASGKVNKFPGMLDILRKIKFSKMIHKMQLLFPEEYSFYPKSWMLPTELHRFVQEAKAAQKKSSSKQLKKYYIVKPDNSSQGDGIYLIRNPNDMMKSVTLKPVVVQEYIPDPLLIDNKKFDLRIYVVLKSLEPLEFYLCREGMARFCTEDYQQPSDKNLHHIFMHLTNYSLNKRSSNFVQSDDVAEGSKRTLTSVLQWLQERQYDVRQFHRDLEEVVCKTILAIVPDLKVRCHLELPRNPRKHGPSCFQILGLDVLLTSDLKPYLLEVNASPSLNLDGEQERSPGVYETLPSPVDREIKIPLVRDTLALFVPKRRKTSTVAITTDDCSDQDAGSADDGADAISHLSLEVNAESEEPNAFSGEPKGSCLVKLFPEKYAKRLKYKNFRVFERITSIYLHFLGLHGTRMGQTAFRKFTRTCKLCINGFSTAEVDIMYIDISRRWNALASVTADVSAGLCFNGFTEAVSNIAERKFPNVENHLEKVLALVDLCESYLALE